MCLLIFIERIDVESAPFYMVIIYHHKNNRLGKYY
nr:MAG TPA: hypothetical protein [Caudoviricetes sp.]